MESLVFNIVFPFLFQGHFLNMQQNFKCAAHREQTSVCGAANVLLTTVVLGYYLGVL